MTTGRSPPFPPGISAPPAVPEGWTAQWSYDEKAWYFVHAATQTSTWENPLNKESVAPPPYANASNTPPFNPNFYDSSDKSPSARGFSPLHGLAGGLAVAGIGRVFHHNDHHDQSYTPPINEATRPSNNALYIHAACFGDQDITQKVRAMVTPQQSLTIHSDALTYHFGDPWPNHRKQFALLYSYGQQPWQVVVCMEGSETVDLHPSFPVDRLRAEFLQPPNSRIVALVWGLGNALAGNAAFANGRSVGLKTMELEREGRLEATNSWMGFDGNPNVEKVAVVFYRHADGSIGVLTAREGDTLRLPWNTMA